MPLLDAIIKEGLRLDPPGPFIVRRVKNPDTPLGPYILPQGISVRVNVYGIHHDPQYWDAPEEFRPERFLGVDVDIDSQGAIMGGKKDPLAWVPFSYGARSCIGMNFSLIEQRVMIAMLVQKLSWRLPQGSVHEQGLKYRPGLMLDLEKLEVEFTKRS